MLFRDARATIFCALFAASAVAPALAVTAAPTPIPQAATPLPADVGAPAGTTLHFHVLSTLSSNGSKTGDRFVFQMDGPVVCQGKTLVAAGATGNGTLVLAGPAGIKGHEGDLTLRLDNVWTVDRKVLELNQTIAIDGRNYKAYTAAAGLVPFVGVAGSLVHGQNITITPSVPIMTVLKQDALIATAN